MTFIKHEPPPKVCRHSGHRPPTHIVLAPGTHTWRCDACGEITSIIIPEILMKVEKEKPQYPSSGYFNRFERKSETVGEEMDRVLGSNRSESESRNYLRNTI